MHAGRRVIGNWRRGDEDDDEKIKKEAKSRRMGLGGLGVVVVLLTVYNK